MNTFKHLKRNDQLQHHGKSRQPQPLRDQPGQGPHRSSKGRGQAARPQGRGTRRDRRHQLLRHGTIHRGDGHREVCPPHRRPRHDLLPRRHHGDPLHGSRLHARAAAGGQEDPPRRARRLLPSAQQQGRGDGGEVQLAEHPARHGLLGAGQRVPQPPRRRRVQPRRHPFGPGSRPQGHQGGQDQRRYLRAHQPGRKPLQPGRHDEAEETHADGPLGQREPG